MEPTTPQSEFDKLALVGASLEADYSGIASAWAGSPFAWIIKVRSSAQRGKIGEQLIGRWCGAEGLSVLPSKNSDADMIIEGKRVEVKFSTLWSSGGYRFQQIRNQDYDVLVCFGLSPFEAHVWMLRKEDIPFSDLRHQHGGSRGRDTWWVEVDPAHPPQWLLREPEGLRSLKDFFIKQSQGKK